jgi:hypothetical protein
LIINKKSPVERALDGGFLSKKQPLEAGKKPRSEGQAHSKNIRSATAPSLGGGFEGRL